MSCIGGSICGDEDSENDWSWIGEDICTPSLKAPTNHHLCLAILKIAIEREESH